MSASGLMWFAATFQRIDGKLSAKSVMPGGSPNQAEGIFRNYGDDIVVTVQAFDAEDALTRARRHLEAVG